METEEVDLLVIGGGVAGLTAALVAAGDGPMSTDHIAADHIHIASMY